MDNSTTLRQAINKVSVEGYLKAKKLEMKKEKDGTSVISGSITILVPPNNEVILDVYTRELTSKGEKNKAFAGLVTVMEHYVSMASLMSGENGTALSRDEAMKECTKVTTTGQLTRREYMGQDGNMVSRDSISSNFYSSVEALENPRSAFTLECYFRSFKDEYRGGEPTGRILADVYVPMYKGAILPFTLAVSSDMADEVRSFYQAGDSALINGDYVNTIIKTESKGGFGRSNETTTLVHELLLMGGDPPYGEGSPKAFSPEAIKAAELYRNNEYLPSLETKGSKKTTGYASSAVREAAQGFTY